MSSAINHNDLQIGQVLYIVSDKQTRVIPVVVSEQAITRTLEGNTTTWKVIIGPKEKRKTYDLKSITGEKFFTLAEAKQALLSRFTGFLNETIAESEKTTKEWYGIELGAVQAKQVQKRTTPDQENFDPESILDSIDNDTEALPTGMVNPLFGIEEAPRLSPDDSPEVRRAKLRAMAEAENNEEQTSVNLGPQKPVKVILPESLGGGEVTINS
jgi:hypothetical protein